MALVGWAKNSVVTINKDYITGDIVAHENELTAVNFPSELLAASGGCNDNGSDIRFSSDSGGNNLLDFDLQMIDKAAGEIVVHVQADVSATVDTVIYLFWGNASAQFPLGAVWAKYYAAIHFQEAPTGDGFKTASDSAGTYNAMSEKGTPIHVAGMVSGQKGWNCKTSNYAIMEEEMNISGDFYFEFLINFNGAAPTAGTQNIFSPVDYFSGVGSVGIGINYGSLVVRDTTFNAGQFPDWNAWTHVAFYREAGTIYYYMNGTLAGSGAFTADIERLKWLSGSDSPARPVQYPNTDFSISNLRFTRTGPIANPVDVIQTRWNNYNNIAAFASSGPVQTVVTADTLTIVGVQDGTEIRIYDEEDSMNELGGIEESVGDFVLNFSGTKLVTIVIMSVQYAYIRYTNIVLSGNISIPITQTVDLTYKND